MNKYFDNVRVNHSFNFIFLICYFAIFTLLYENTIIDAGINSLISILIYAFSSAFFQPDLDQKINRPGKESFPLGSLYKISFLKKIKPILYPVNRIWYYFWAPYGYLLTHRGISHWAVIGTYTRVIYLLGITHIINYILKISLFNGFFDLFFNLNFSLKWAIFASPIFLSDIMHLVVDALDSLRKNTPFKSFTQEPGILIQMINPKAMKYHKKGLRGARKKKKKKKKI